MVISVAAIYVTPILSVSLLLYSRNGHMFKFSVRNVFNCMSGTHGLSEEFGRYKRMNGMTVCFFAELSVRGSYIATRSPCL